MAPLHLTLLGGFQAHSPTKAAVAIPVKKAKALLAYLALNPGHAHPRDKLASLLWEDSGETQARHSLRQALVCLRRALPPSVHVISAIQDALLIPLHSVEVDVLTFERLLQEGTTEAIGQAVALYQGELLEGFNPGSAGFEDWLMERRGQLRERAIAAAETLLIRQLADQPGQNAVELALRLVSWDPLRESAQRTLMALYVRQGRYGAALKQYQMCRSVLQRELGVEPDAQTEALHQAILQQRRTDAADDLYSARPGPREGEEASRSVTIPSPAARRAVDIDSPADPQLRQASVLVARLAGGDAESPDLEERHAAQQGLLARVHVASARLGGCMIQQAQAAAMVIFGIPQARGNEAERAVRTALALQQSPAGDDSPLLRIGIASGPVLVSRWCSDPLSHTITGDAVETADALCTRAEPGETLISEAVYGSLREWIVVENPAPAEVAAGTPPFWRLLALRAEPQFEQSAFIGRQAPLRQLASTMEFCRETGCGQAVLVRGEAGIGKTRLVEELAVLGAQHGFACHRAVILDFGPATDQDTLLPLLYGLLGLAGGMTAEQTQAAVGRALAEGIITSGQEVFLSDLLGLSPPVHSEYDAMRYDTRQQGKQAVLGRLLTAAAARQPLLLLIEDIHWANTATLDLLAQLAAITIDNPAVLVMTSRLEGEPLNPAWRGAMHGTALLTLDLGPLRPDEALELASQFDELDPGVVARCIQRASGNPFFLEQLLRAAQAGDDRIPDSVQSLVWAALDRLPPVDRAAIQTASVMGQRFPLAALHHLLEDPEYRCDRLVEHCLLRPEDGGYWFAHTLIREGIYASLLKTQQRELHQRAAAWFSSRDSRLHAEHLERAGDSAAADAYLGAARDQLGEQHLESALWLLGRGLELASDERTGFELACLQGETLRQTGKIDAALASFEQALTKAPTTVDRAQAWLGIAQGLEIQDRYSQALDALDRAQDCAGREASANLLARIHCQRGNICFPLGRIDTCFREHELALRHARTAASPGLEARALSGLGDAYYQRGRMLTAHRHFERCVALCRQQGLAGIEAGNLAMLGLTRFYQNDLSGAVQDGMAAAEIGARIGNQRDESLALNMLGLVYQHMGRWQEAYERIERSLELARTLGSRRFETENLGNLAFVAAMLGRQSQAEHWLEQAWALSRATGAAYIGPWILGLWARVTYDRVRRARLLEEGEALLSADSVSHNHLHFYQNAMEMALIERDWQGTERYASALTAYTSAEPLPWSEFFIARARVLARHGRGDHTPELVTTLQTLLAQAENAGLQDAAVVLRAALGQ